MDQTTRDILELARAALIAEMTYRMSLQPAPRRGGDQAKLALRASRLTTLAMTALTNLLHQAQEEPCPQG